MNILIQLEEKVEINKKEFNMNTLEDINKKYRSEFDSFTYKCIEEDMLKIFNNGITNKLINKYENNDGINKSKYYHVCSLYYLLVIKNKDKFIEYNKKSIKLKNSDALLLKYKIYNNITTEKKINLLKKIIELDPECGLAYSFLINEILNSKSKDGFNTMNQAVNSYKITETMYKGIENKSVPCYIIACDINLDGLENSNPRPKYLIDKAELFLEETNNLLELLNSKGKYNKNYYEKLRRNIIECNDKLELLKK